MRGTRQRISGVVAGGLVTVLNMACGDSSKGICDQSIGTSFYWHSGDGSVVDVPRDPQPHDFSLDLPLGPAPDNFDHEVENFNVAGGMWQTWADISCDISEGTNSDPRISSSGQSLNLDINHCREDEEGEAPVVIRLRYLTSLEDVADPVYRDHFLYNPHEVLISVGGKPFQPIQAILFPEDFKIFLRRAWDYRQTCQNLFYPRDQSQSYTPR